MWHQTLRSYRDHRFQKMWCMLLALRAVMLSMAPLLTPICNFLSHVDWFVTIVVEVHTGPTGCSCPFTVPYTTQQFSSSSSCFLTEVLLSSSRGCRIDECPKSHNNLNSTKTASLPWFEATISPVHLYTNTRPGSAFPDDCACGSLSHTMQVIRWTVLYTTSLLIRFCNMWPGP